MLTREQALQLAETEFWKEMSHRDIAMFQLWEDKLCMPFTVFHEAVEKALLRPVWTHEFARRGLLQKELLGDRNPPSFDEILELIPVEKRIVVAVSNA